MPEEKKNRWFKKGDSEFLMRTLILSLMIMALLHAFTPYLTDSVAAVSRNDVEDLSRSSKFLSPRDIENYLKNAEKPTMIMVYASWCGYCQKVVPSIHQLWLEKKIPGTQLLMISVDDNTTALSTYLLTNKFNDMVSLPLMVKEEPYSLRNALRDLGADFEGGIPYIGFFAPGGKKIDEIQGYVEKPIIENALEALK